MECLIFVCFRPLLTLLICGNTDPQTPKLARSAIVTNTNGNFDRPPLKGASIACAES